MNRRSAAALAVAAFIGVGVAVALVASFDDGSPAAGSAQYRGRERRSKLGPLVSRSNQRGNRSASISVTA